MYYLKAAAPFAALLIAVSPGVAQAYIDPGTGSIVVQMVVGAIVGVSFALKLWWRRIRLFVAKLFSRKPR